MSAEVQDLPAVQFEDPPPRGKFGSDERDWTFAGKLRDTPGQWALYAEHKLARQAENDRARINRGSRAFRGGRFEVKRSQVGPHRFQVHVRYIGPDS